MHRVGDTWLFCTRSEVPTLHANPDTRHNQTTKHTQQEWIYCNSIRFDLQGYMLHSYILSLQDKFSETWFQRTVGMMFLSPVWYRVSSISGLCDLFCCSSSTAWMIPLETASTVSPFYSSALPNDAERHRGSAAAEPVAFTATSAADTRIDIQEKLITHLETLTAGTILHLCMCVWVLLLICLQTA